MQGGKNENNKKGGLLNVVNNFPKFEKQIQKIKLQIGPKMRNIDKEENEETDPIVENHYLNAC